MAIADRNLSVYAGGRPVTGFRHARLTGTDSAGLPLTPFGAQIIRGSHF